MSGLRVINGGREPAGDGAAPGAGDVGASVELDAIYAHAPVGLALIDRDLRFVRINEALAAINGVPASEHVGRTVAEVVPDLADAARALMDRMIGADATIGPVELEGETRAAPGVRRVWLEYWSPVRDEAGRIVAASVSAIEATDRVLRERAARDEANDARRLMDSVLPFIGRLTPDGTLTEVNATALRASGVAREAVLGAPFWECPWWSYDAAVQARLRDAVARAAAGETVRYDVAVRVFGPDGAERRITIDFVLMPLHDEGGRVVEIVPSGVDITARLAAQAELARNLDEMRRVDRHRVLLLAELRHRIRNTLAAVQAISSQTARAAPDPAEFHGRFAGRLRAIAAAHDLAIEGPDAAPLRALVAAQVGPYAEGGPARLRLEGPDAALDAERANALGLVLHELATNAARHGALSRAEGGVAVTWQVEDGVLRLDWVERGGPAVAPPAREGFGARLIRGSLSHGFGGGAEIEYRAQGVVARLRLPLGDGRRPVAAADGAGSAPATI